MFTGDTEQSKIFRRLRISVFPLLGMETEGNTLGGIVIWGAGSRPETQNWLVLAPELTNAHLRTRPRFLISCTFKVNDVRKQAEASTLLQTVMPFCGNCRALADSLEGYNLFIADGASHPSSKDLRTWARGRI